MPLTIIPQAGQTLLQTRDPIANNFSLIDTAFSVNHVDYGNANQGKHNFVSMPYQTTSPATAASEMALYTQGGTLYLQPQSQIAGAAGIPLSGTGVGLDASPGWIRLPTNTLMFWGNTQAASFSFAAGVVAGFPGFANVYSLQCTALWNAGPNVVSPQVSGTTVTPLVYNPITGGLNPGEKVWYFMIGD